MKSFYNKLALSLAGLLIILCYSCETSEQVATDAAGKPTAIKTKQPETKPLTVQPKPGQQPPQRQVKTAAKPTDIIAKIGDYVITRGELEKSIMEQLRPDPYGDEDSGKDKPVDTKTALMEMIAEKAMLIDGRKKNYLEDESIQTSLKKFKNENLANLLFKTHLQGKITITDSEIDEKLKTNPRLNRARARAMVGREKAGKLAGQFYDEICKKLHVQKLSGNFPKAIQIRQRLLRSLYSKEYRGIRWVRTKQVMEDLTLEEKNIALATFDNGKVTLKEWFDSLCEYSPPSRPKDLDSPKGVERLLDRTMSAPIFAAEARSRGLDKDETFLKQVKEREDAHLFGKAMQETLKNFNEPTNEPTAEEVIAYFNKHKEEFGIPDKVRIEQIWCQDLKTARQVKAELDSGTDFESVRQKYSFDKKSRVPNTYPGREGIFFKDLWNSEPNKIIGPVKGFHRREGLKWRIVKILEKTPGKPNEYSSNMENRIKDRIMSEQRDATLAEYRKELLEKYSYKIYAERITDIAPLDIP